jgi:hypothetical protein
MTLLKNILVFMILAAALLAGCSQPTDDDSGGGAAVLSDVGGLSGTVDYQTVTLNWTNPEDRLLYRIEISGEPNITTVTKAFSAEPTHTFSGLNNNEAYTFTVKAIYYPGEDSDKSPGAIITLVPNTHAAGSLTAIPGNGRVSLKWTDPTFADFDHFEITWAGENSETGGPVTVAGNLLNTVIPGLINEVRYEFTLKAVDTANNPRDGASVAAIPSAAALWFEAVSSFGSSAVNHVAWGGTPGNEKFVAVGAAGKIAYSADGKTWTAVPSGTLAGESGFDSSTAVNGVAWGGEKFVAVGASGAMAWSANGVNWTRVTTSGFSTTAINGITWGGPLEDEKFVAVGASGKIAYSGNGTTWTAIPAGTTDETTTTFGSAIAVNRVTWGGGKFVAVGASGETAASADGTTWTGGSVGSTASTIQDIAWGNGRFVAVPNNTSILWSEDGLTWTREAQDSHAWGMIGNTNVSFRSAAWDGNKFVVGGPYLVNGYSRDGEEWMRLPRMSTASTDNITGIAWNGMRLVAVGANGRILYTD